MDRAIKQALVWVVATAVVVSILWLAQYHYRLYVFQKAMEKIATATQRALPSGPTAEESTVESVDPAQRRRQKEREFERAFLATYEDAEGCEQYDSQQHMVECVNHRMRARQSLREEFFGDGSAAVLKAPEGR